jgi:hypothetical protein
MPGEGTRAEFTNFKFDPVSKCLDPVSKYLDPTPGGARLVDQLADLVASELEKLVLPTR